MYTPENKQCHRDGVCASGTEKYYAPGTPPAAERMIRGLQDQLTAANAAFRAQRELLSHVLGDHAATEQTLRAQLAQLRVAHQEAQTAQEKTQQEVQGLEAAASQLLRAQQQALVAQERLRRDLSDARSHLEAAQQARAALERERGRAQSLERRLNRRDSTIHARDLIIRARDAELAETRQRLEAVLQRDESDGGSERADRDPIAPEPPTAHTAPPRPPPAGLTPEPRGEESRAEGPR